MARVIDNTCPYSGECYANYGCIYTCPETLYDVLHKTAALEHELEMTPHTDPDVLICCSQCKSLEE